MQSPRVNLDIPFALRSHYLMSDRTPRYRWRETWPGERHRDYVGYDGKLQIGRMYWQEYQASGLPQSWSWTISTLHVPSQPATSLHGAYRGCTAREAACRIEDLYDRMLPLATVLYSMTTEDAQEHLRARGLPWEHVWGNPPPIRDPGPKYHVR